jgi:hypothetical protein
MNATSSDRTAEGGGGGGGERDREFDLNGRGVSVERERSQCGLRDAPKEPSREVDSTGREDGAARVRGGRALGK